jgi:hypothetical protein
MWLDRITGEKVKVLPGEIEPSRFVACTPIDINGHVTLEKGGMLVDDGSGRLLCSDQESVFSKLDEDLALAGQGDVIISALMEFRDATNKRRSRSFLLPEKLLTWLHLQDLDLSIQKVVEAGHLHEIARAPRMDLIYQEYLLPVSRVKRIPSSATRHLAAHSECWQKLSFSGVIPKTLLALESEDEYNIYENRVFARLLDHIENYLRRRCSEVACIEEAIKEREKLDGSGVYWEASNAICSLWGEGFTVADSFQDEAIQGQDTLSALRLLLRKIRGLQESRLYKAIPIKDVVGFKIKMTNALTHDQHYRHVGKLWHQWIDFSKKERVEPDVIFSQNTENAEAYVTYVSALTIRALEELGYSNSNDGILFVSSGRNPVVVETAHYNIVLKSGDSILRIVPLFSQHLGDYSSTVSSTTQTVLITPENIAFDMKTMVQAGSPLYFYTLEAMVVRLSSWLTLETVKVMSQSLEKLPAQVVDIIGAKYSEYFEIDKNKAILRFPLGEQLEQIKKDLSQISHNESTLPFLSNLEEYSHSLDALLICPVCGSQTVSNSYVPRDDRCFEIRGSSCSHVWKIDRDASSSRSFIVEPTNTNEPENVDKNKLINYGRYKWSIGLPK